MAHVNIIAFIWNIANVLRDVVKPGKRQDIILPMCVLRRLDAVLEPTKDAVLAEHKRLKKENIHNMDSLLKKASKQAFYNTSKFTLKTLIAGGGRQSLLSDFNNYLNGFSPNVKEIMGNFHFQHNLKILSDNNLLGTLIERFTASNIDLSPSGLDNHGMGTIFEELVRRFNESNNEEAGEHWTPRDAVQLMAQLVFHPIKDQIKSGTYTIYDCACGTGGMMTVAERELLKIAEKHDVKIKCRLYGQETNPETLAVCKADMLLKGEGIHADNIKEKSTLSADAFSGKRFNFMLANPPYGKDWKSDFEALGGKNGINDPRFNGRCGNETLSLITRSSDGQMLFLANMVNKMQSGTEISRIAEVHNGSSLSTGDAGQGESNIRRWIVENDWLEAIVALPENMFYNTGIATYVWVLSNRKTNARRGKVQLINATEWFSPLSRNLGKKNCELSLENIEKIIQTFLDFKNTRESKIFPNQAFGYRKIIVERPLRLRAQLSPKAIDKLRFASGDSDIRKKLYDVLGDDVFVNFSKIADKANAEIDRLNAENDANIDDTCKQRLLTPQKWEKDAKLFSIAKQLRDKLGDNVFNDYNDFRAKITETLGELQVKSPQPVAKCILDACSWRDPNALPVKRKTHVSQKSNPLYGLFTDKKLGQTGAIEYEPDTKLRDREQVPLLEKNGIEGFFRREVLPYTPDAWISQETPKIGYEINFTRHFYKPQKMRTLGKIRNDIVVTQKEKGETIALLEKKNRGVINRAITRGLDSSVSLKSSKSSFIGKVPQHWKIVRSKYLFECMKEINFGMKNINVLSLTLRGVVNNDPENPEGLVPRDYATYQIVRKDDIIFKLIDLENFQTSRVGLVHEDGIMSSAYVRFSPITRKINVRFFYYQFYDFYMRRIFNQIGKGVRSTLGAPDLLNLPVCVPPLPEQNAIVKYINNTTTQIDDVAKCTNLEIALLREYRARLVADAVTGQIDARNFTASSSKGKKRI